MVRTHGPTHRKKGRVLPIGQQYPRPLDPARRLRSRASNRAQRRQILRANGQFDRLPPSRHRLNPRFSESCGKLQTNAGKVNPTQPAQMIGFKESMN
jgi:hypothetical protein